MPSPTSGRSLARRLILQMLFLVDQNADADRKRIVEQFDRELRDPAIRSFAVDVFEGVSRQREDIDALIRQTAENWRLERMLPTDRNVLRMGIYELRHTDTPAAVVLDEAIEIAREFGTQHSAAFVNGILDRLIPNASETSADVRSSD